jgi:hypothetical protein
MFDVKRLNYFHHQFLDEKDFQDEQSYHISMRRLHNRTLHRWGVVEGLTVERRGDRQIIVRPGFAIDREGREIVLGNEIVHDVANSGGGGHAYVTIAYKESHHEDDRQNASGMEGYRRTTELPELHARRHTPSELGATVVLARIHLDGSGNISDIDMEGRQTAGVAIGPGAIDTPELADDSVTEAKLAPGSVTEESLAPYLRGSFGAKGWVRLPFKPVRLPAAKPSGKVVVHTNDEDEFVIDIAVAYCGSRGARGSMAIPTPPGATRIKAFRLAGNTRGTVIVQLMRTGWHASEHRGEATEILTDFIREVAFDKHLVIAEHLRHLDPQFHALALAVTADEESQIWLVAAEFE